ncbi:hypothetical protein J3Q64DRAFT_1779918 [Phycomyces blakesleeanus]|uniref:RNase III domain-containing protein n=1 Tax=Phycomyces blakesleeanus TaxID=4837 RepID=A0ABR3AI50_PHYBL
MTISKDLQLKEERSTEPLQCILSRMLVGLVDECGNQLRVEEELAFFRLAFGDLNVLTNQHNQISFKHPAFIGKSVLNLAVSNFLSTEYQWIDQERMEQMHTLIFSNDKLYEMIEIFFEFDKYRVDTSLHDNTVLIVDAFIGILYEHHEYSAVEQWITSLLKLFCPVIFKLLPRTLYNRLFGLENEENDVSLLKKPETTEKFLNYVVRGKGDIKAINIETVLPAPLSGWSVEIKYKLSPKAEWYIHSRHGPSKRKARELAIVDIVSYYYKNPEMIHSHHLPSLNSRDSPENVLLIPYEDYYDIELSLKSLMILKPVVKKEDILEGAGYKRRIMFLDADDNDNDLMVALLGDLLAKDIAEKLSVEESLSKNDSYNPNKEPSISQNLSPRSTNYIDPCYITEPPDSSIRDIKHDISTFSVYKQEDLDSVKAAIAQRPRLKRALNDNTRQRQPKDYIERIKYILGADITISLESFGPQHSLLFKATCLFRLSKFEIITKAVLSKKSEAEMQAYRNLIDLLKEQNNDGLLK